MTDAADFDVVIMGGGLVGAATALALCGQGLRLALVEAGAAPQQPPHEGWDARIYAISPGNAAFLQRLGAWDALDQSRIAPIEQMRVWGDDPAARLDFSAYESGVPALGYIAESRLMQAGLWARLEQQLEVTLLCGAQCVALTWGGSGAVLALQDGRRLTAGLVVGADGGNSWTRTQAGVGVTTSDYRQMGVVANFEAELPHRNIARQWFREDGILAWLPLPGNRISIVWSTPAAHAEALLALPAGELQARVMLAGHRELGELQLMAPAAAFPLKRQNAEVLVKPGLALVGDAAHLVHPLAGQGVNLGFHDAVCLAEVLAGRGAQRNVGEYGVLRRYERARKADIMAMQGMTSGLNDLFGSRLPGLEKLRNAGLALTNRQGWLKKQLIAHAMT